MFPVADFWKFCSRLTINSKEMGSIRLARPYGPQRWIIKCIAEGLEDEVHDFTILKCRQLGASTVFLALDLYWLFVHGGMDGTLVTQDEQTFVNFRTTLTEFYHNLPKAYKPFSPAHNRSEFVFRHKNGKMSRLQYQIAGTRMGQSVKLGRAKGNAFCHGTEVAYWADQGSFQSLKNSLAEINPVRLFLWESTANGFNGFEEQWRIADKAITQRAIFVSWWAHEMYRVSRDSNMFKVYWGTQGHMTGEERELAREVAALHGDVMEFVWGTKEISPEQVAWYRWYSEEKVADPDMAKQEMPWIAEQAFVTTGSQYFASKDLTINMRRVTREDQPTPMRIELGEELSHTRISEVPPRIANLGVFASPIENGRYVLGADPAYGSSDWADAFCVSVWRCWFDRIEQVAEFRVADYEPYAFAWVIVYLCAMYAPCAWNLEITGPGAAVLAEVDNLRRGRYIGDTKTRQMMNNFLGGMTEFLYTRFDSLNRNPIARGTQSTLKEKNRYMDLFKGYFRRGFAVCHSKPLLDEMRWITQEPGCAPGGSARHKDDRVIAAALAVYMWHEKLRARLAAGNVNYAAEQKMGAPRVASFYQQLAERQKQLLGLVPRPTVPPIRMLTRRR
jgi:hypothetical protein